MLRLGLVCKFVSRPIQFRSATATSLLKMDRHAALTKLSRLILENAATLQRALVYCTANGIGAFRVSSTILPLKTHPEAGYEVEELPEAGQIVEKFKACGIYAKEHNVRLSFHPGQFTLLSSHNADVTRRSLADIEYHTQVATWVGADVINIHAGGAYGNKEEALSRVAANLTYLSEGARSLLTVENDDKVYTPADLLPLCHREGLPLVYDVHHHRVLPDGKTVAEVTQEAVKMWEREPLFHISTPREGWNGSHPERHHDYINPREFPESWKELAKEQSLTVEVEAKAKELAVLALLHTLHQQAVPLRARQVSAVRATR